MKAHILTFGVAFLLASSVWANEEHAFKYEEGRSAARDYEQAAQKAAREYAAAVRAARKEYAAALDAALKAAMERGDLEEANRLNAAKETVAKELAALPRTPTSTEDVATPSDQLPTLVGTWRYDNASRTTITFRPDGTYTRSWDRNAKPGTWRHVEGRKFKIAEDVVELSADLNSYPNPNPKGKGQVVRRILPVSSRAESNPGK